jgi:chorismate mutase
MPRAQANSTAEKLAECQQAIAELTARIQDHKQERQTLSDAVAAVKADSRDPQGSIEAGRQRKELSDQIKALNDAIALLDADLRSQQTRLTALQERAAIEVDEAELAAATDQARSLAAEGRELQQQMSEWLTRVRELSQYNQTLRRQLTRQMPTAFPSSAHAASARRRIAASGFLEGSGVWHLPQLVEHGDRFELAAAIVDISEKPAFAKLGPPTDLGAPGPKVRSRPQSDFLKPVPASDGKVTARSLGFNGPSTPAKT